MGILTDLAAFFAPRRTMAFQALREASAMRERRQKKLREPFQFYDAASTGHRTASWRPVGGDADGEVKAGAARVREVARDLVRNNAWAKRAKQVVVSNTIGTGIIPTATTSSKRMTERLEALMVEHFDSPAIDARGRNNLYGLQALAMGTVFEAGECLIRYRQRRRQDGLPLPFQIEVLEPEFLDTQIDGEIAGGGWAVQGIEYDATGAVAAYHLFDVHPGASSRSFEFQSTRVPADLVAHMFLEERPGQSRGVSWLAPVVFRLHDFLEYVDAQVVSKRTAATFSAFIETADFDSIPLDGTSTAGDPLERLTPGTIKRMAPGEQIRFASPPQVNDYSQFMRATLQEIAAGLGISYEALTGDLSSTNYSSGRMGWLEFQRNIEHWRNNMIAPQFSWPLSRWFLQNAGAAGIASGGREPAKIVWTPPRREMISPKDEIAPIVQQIRAGLMTRSEALRRLGYDPLEVDTEFALDNERADEMELVFDSDARLRAQNGGALGAAAESGEESAENPPNDAESDENAENTPNGGENDENDEPDEATNV